MPRRLLSSGVPFTSFEHATCPVSMHARRPTITIRAKKLQQRGVPAILKPVRCQRVIIRNARSARLVNARIGCPPHTCLHRHCLDPRAQRVRFALAEPTRAACRPDDRRRTRYDDQRREYDGRGHHDSRHRRVRCKTVTAAPLAKGRPCPWAPHEQHDPVDVARGILVGRPTGWVHVLQAQ